VIVSEFSQLNSEDPAKQSTRTHNLNEFLSRSDLVSCVFHSSLAYLTIIRFVGALSTFARALKLCVYVSVCACLPGSITAMDDKRSCASTRAQNTVFGCNDLFDDILAFLHKPVYKYDSALKKWPRDVHHLQKWPIASRAFYTSFLRLSKRDCQLEWLQIIEKPEKVTWTLSLNGRPLDEVLRLFHIFKTLGSTLPAHLLRFVTIPYDVDAMETILGQHIDQYVTNEQPIESWSSCAERRKRRPAPNQPSIDIVVSLVNFSDTTDRILQLPLQRIKRLVLVGDRSLQTTAAVHARCPDMEIVIRNLSPTVVSIGQKEQDVIMTFGAGRFTIGTVYLGSYLFMPGGLFAPKVNPVFRQWLLSRTQHLVLNFQME
jgi:hypothetical protein